MESFGSDRWSTEEGRCGPGMVRSKNIVESPHWVGPSLPREGLGVEEEGGWRWGSRPRHVGPYQSRKTLFVEIVYTPDVEVNHQDYVPGSKVL